MADIIDFRKARAAIEGEKEKPTTICPYVVRLKESITAAMEILVVAMAEVPDEH